MATKAKTGRSSAKAEESSRPPWEARKRSQPVGAQKRDAPRTREKILEAAVREFADKGLDGARVDEIARRSGVNKHMLYHYYGSKDRLFTATLERIYDAIHLRHQDLGGDGLEPEQAMRALVESVARMWVESPDSIRLLSSENLHQARHVKGSTKILQMYTPVLETVAEILRQGARKGIFRQNIDPLDTYISISALSAHYVSNRHTLETVFRTKLLTPKRWDQRVRHITDMVLRFLKRQ